jgi:dipeptidyl aminopeptidase/acylaminoacyl peptidase
MQLDDLFRTKAVGRSAISPDGRQVVFELKRFDLNENKNFVQLMIAEVATRSVRPLTAGNHSDTMPRWSPDGARLAFLSDREKTTCLYVMEMTGGEPRRVTDRDGHARDFDWSPDGRRLVYAYQPLTEREKLERDEKKEELKRRPQYKHVRRLKHKLDGAGWWNGEYAHVHLVLASGGKSRQLTFGDYDDLEPRFSPDGRLVSFVSNRVENPDLNFENADIHVVRPAGGPIRKITDMQGGCAGHAWSPDGQWIAYIGDAARPGQGWKHVQQIWVVPARGGRPRNVSRHIDNQCMNVTLGDVTGQAFEHVPLIWSADGREVMFLVSSRGSTHLVSQRIGARQSHTLIGGQINVFSAQRTGADGPIAISAGSGTQPGDVFVYSGGTVDLGRKLLGRPAGAMLDGPLRQLSDVNRDLFERVEISTPEEFTVRNGSTQLQGWILRPPRFNPRRRYPAILEIHGGPAAQYGASFFHEMQWMAAKGYVVLFGNPRGSAGYGLNYMRCIHADWGNLDFKDVMRLADHLFSRPYVDRRRVGVTGGSYGGFMTNWLVGHTDRFRAAATQRSVVNLESMFGTSDFGYDLGNDAGGKPWENVERLRSQSPLKFVRNIRTPLLIEHEEEDHRCPIEQAEQLFTALKVLGRTVELVRFEGESHGLSRGGRPQNRRERLRWILAWFDKYLAG